MFTGIVQKLGKMVECDLQEKWGRVTLDPGAWDRPVEMGESIAVSGICLTVTRIEGTRLGFDVLRETFEKTNLGEKKTGDRLNMERALRWGDPLGGHIMIGHVDGIGRVCAVEPVGRDWKYEIACEPRLMDGMVYKGSVSVDGVSLTLAEIRDDRFLVHIIPFTHEHTTFGCYHPGDAVNIEVDLLGKFVRRYVDRGIAFPGLTWDALRRAGLISGETEPPPAC